MTEVKNVLDNAGGKSTQPYYVEVKDGNGFPTLHLNFDNPAICPRKGLIVLEPMKPTKRHNSKMSMRAFTDKSSGTPVRAGIPIRIDKESGEYIYQQIQVVDREVLDLSIIGDAKKWAVIRLCPFLEGSPNLGTGVPVYKVYDEEKIAQRKLSERSVKRKATTIAEGLYGRELTDMARACGISLIGRSETSLQVAVIDYAEDKPKEFMNLWDSPSRQENFIFKQALEMGIVNQDTAGFLYRTQFLGHTESEVVEYLRSHPNVSIAISAMTKEMESDTVKALSNKEAPKVGDDKDVLLNEKDAEIAALRKLLQANTSKVVEDSLKEDGPPSQYDTLLADAKRLKIKGSHLMSEENLKKAVDLAQTQKV